MEANWQENIWQIKENILRENINQITKETNTIDGFTFVWITDGNGWDRAKGNLRETIEAMKNVYNIDDMEKGVMGKAFKIK